MEHKGGDEVKKISGNDEFQTDPSWRVLRRRNSHDSLRPRVCSVCQGLLESLSPHFPHECPLKELHDARRCYDCSQPIGVCVCPQLTRRRIEGLQRLSLLLPTNPSKASITDLVHLSTIPLPMSHLQASSSQIPQASNISLPQSQPVSTIQQPTVPCRFGNEDSTGDCPGCACSHCGLLQNECPFCGSLITARRGLYCENPVCGRNLKTGRRRVARKVPPPDSPPPGIPKSVTFDEKQNHEISDEARRQSAPVENHQDMAYGTLSSGISTTSYRYLLSVPGQPSTQGYTESDPHVVAVDIHPLAPRKSEGETEQRRPSMMDKIRRLSGLTSPPPPEELSSVPMNMPAGVGQPMQPLGTAEFRTRFAWLYRTIFLFYIGGWVAIWAIMKYAP